MTLDHFLIHRYKVDSVHYLTPTDDNQYQTDQDEVARIFSAVNKEVGQIIVADVDHARVEGLLAPDRIALGKLIRKQR